MALTQVNTDGVKDDAVTAGKIPANAVGSSEIADDAVGLAQMAAGTDGQVITYDASGNPKAIGPGTDGQVLTSAGAGAEPAFEDAVSEGTQVKSTGESGGTKFLREDGDGTSSWQTLPASGATLSGSTDNTVVTVTGANAMQGESTLTYDAGALGITGDSSGDGLSITNNGDHYTSLNFDADRSAANNAIAIIESKWNNTPVSNIRLESGTDTTNKDDGRIVFQTRESGQAMVERMRIAEDGKWYKNDKQILLPLQYFEVNVTGSTNFNTTSSWPDTKQLVTGFTPVKGGSRLWVHSTLQTWWGATSNSSHTDVYARIMATNTSAGSGYEQVWKNSRYEGNFGHNSYYNHDSKHAIFSCVTASDGANMDFKFQAYMGQTLSTDFNICHTNEFNLVQIWEYDIT